MSGDFELKRCKECGEDKDYDAFDIGSKICIDCQVLLGDNIPEKTIKSTNKENTKKRKYKKREVESTEKESSGEKECSKCGDPKMLKEFPKNSGCKDGHAGVCRDCKKEQEKTWRKNRSSKVKKKLRGPKKKRSASKPSKPDPIQKTSEAPEERQDGQPAPVKVPSEFVLPDGSFEVMSERIGLHVAKEIFKNMGKRLIAKIVICVEDIDESGS